MRPIFQPKKAANPVPFAASEQRSGIEADRTLIAAIESSDLPGEIDKANRWTESGDYEEATLDLAFDLASTVVGEVFRFVWRNGCSSPKQIDEAFRRWFAVTKVMRPDLLIPAENTDPLSCQEIGYICSVSRCAISKLAELFSRQWGVHARFQKPETSRGSYRDAANRSWRSRRELDQGDELEEGEVAESVLADRKRVPGPLVGEVTLEAAVRVSRGAVVVVFPEAKLTGKGSSTPRGRGPLRG